MPAVTSGKILVSGANGFVAVWVVKSLLERGYTVRATVRSENKGTHLRKIFASYGDKLELVTVPDITTAGAFDEAVKGVDAIEHTASPFHFKADEPEEMITPAVHGTVRILESVAAHGTSVKRVIVTSSVAAVFTAQSTPRTFSEVDWNEGSINDCKANGRNAHPVSKYCASKTLAERAAWEFMEKNKGKLAWDLVVLNPPYVFGPLLHEVSGPDALNESSQEWYDAVVKSTLSPKDLSTTGAEWIDVRDLGDLHALALEKEEAGGQRLLISGGLWKWQDWVNASRKAGADVAPGDTTYDPKTTTHLTVYDVSKSSKIFGFKYRTMDETTRDILADFKSRGWVKA
ncbi:hypothetical protein POSPLADRAFT_1059984 [Postia placenta MAD-698-R-SB12]|uniref:NAD-dependent epimerase/dehydratase domain-containing protein n=1 Tax=Postia placenta MAD-698-R-SB12 TaxID=670580 RepID=A0A1X6MRR3_9APHY|nr:hypothetical protein POSPLADRAFT_1059984 [Postia placenta MAD-698-R-SB12]OSX58892.1 hypothetical protein POSPLADRAFT_1059984 [Postia placenta MAD-698-R-SB12]